ncbi:retrovirus-related Pol polyprotein from transposon opus [Trichonephila clavipes]|nr:retrovirus-related Pol polyprotein from transposon opus [Trichonephila clavipes]
MVPKKTLERIEYSFFWEGLRANVKKFCETRKECQLTRSVRVKDRSPITPVARPELPFQVVNMDLIDPIDPPSSKGHKYILCLVDQHTRWGEAMPVTSLSGKVGRVRIYCLHLATGRKRHTIYRGGLGNDRGEKGRNEGRTRRAVALKSWSDKG